MLITQEIFEAFLKCRTKSHLIGHGVSIEGAAANLPQEALEEVFRRDACASPLFRLPVTG
jgi:hypothetical protein